MPPASCNKFHCDPWRSTLPNGSGSCMCARSDNLIKAGRGIHEETKSWLLWLQLQLQLEFAYICSENGGTLLKQQTRFHYFYPKLINVMSPIAPVSLMNVTCSTPRKFQSVCGKLSFIKMYFTLQRDKRDKFSRVNTGVKQLENINSAAAKDKTVRHIFLKQTGPWLRWEAIKTRDVYSLQ